MSACTTTPKSRYAAANDGPPLFHVDVNKIPDAVPKHEPRSPYGNKSTYVALGRRYHVLKSARGYKARGIASWYGTKFHNHYTSTHERYNMLGMTGASPVLPIPCYARVTNLENGRSVVVKINDRGPFAPNRILDLSFAAAKKLGYIGRGTAHVEIATIEPGQRYDRPRMVEVAYQQSSPRFRTSRSSKHKVYLQVGVFSQLANAQSVKSRISRLTHKEVRINVASVKNRHIYKVQVGPMKGHGESNHVRNQIASAGLGKPLEVVG